MNAPRVGRLHVITDVGLQSRWSHTDLASLAIEGGADTIQFRDKNLNDEDFSELAGRLRALCASAGVPLIVNDRVAVALAFADGVHVGRGDDSAASARAALGPEGIVGASASTPAEVHAAAAAGADYVGVGHVFATQSKRKTTPPLGVEALAKICENAAIPVIAIGGIRQDNVLAVMKAGVWGIAVIAAVCKADEPARATRLLKEAIGRTRPTTLSRQPRP